MGWTNSVPIFHDDVTCKNDLGANLRQSVAANIGAALCKSKLVDSCKNDPGANLRQSVAANIGAALCKSKLVDSCKNDPGANLRQSSRWLQT
jgi:hypothetical protein